MKWQTAELSAVTKRIRNGLNISQSSSVGGLPITRIETISNQIIDCEHFGFAGIEIGQKIDWYLAPGEILFSHINSEDRIGNCAIYKGEPYPLIHGMNLLSLTPNEDVIIPSFLLHAIRTKQFRLALRPIIKRAVNQASVSIGDLKAIKVPIPPLSEQRRIVEILDQVDTLRKKRAEADAKAERIIPALFYKMFGDPVTNSKGWPTHRLDRLCAIIGGGTPSKSETDFWQGDIPWVSPKDMKTDLLEDTKDHITVEAIERSATKLIEKGSILIVYRSGILAHSFPVAIAGVDLTINQDLKALSSSQGKVTNAFLYGWLTCAKSLVMNCVKKGATVHNVDGSRFKSLQVVMPTMSLQVSFGTRLLMILKNKSERRRALSHLDDLFEDILYEAFTGDLTSNWRKAHMAELLSEMELQTKALGKIGS